MKALMLTTSFPAFEGDVRSPFIYELAKAMSKYVDVTVVCPDYKASKNSEENFGAVKVRRFSYFPKRFQILTEHGGLASNMERNPFSYFQLPFFIMSMFFKLLKEVKNCDVIFAQWALAGLVAVIADFFHKKPIILTTRGADVNMSLKNPIYKRILVWVLNRCTFVTSNNQDLINKINSLGISKTMVIYNGVDVEKFRPRDKLKLRKLLNLPTNKKIIIFVGWLIPRKGVNYLIAAIPDVIKKYPAAHFLLIGDGMMRNELEKQILDLNVENQTWLLGTKKPEDVPLWLGAADILILPSIAEGMPNIVLEAMASAVPVVATRISGTPELLKDGFNGYLIDPKNSAQIAEKINKILARPQDIEKLGKNGRNLLFEKGLTWDNSAKRYLDLAKNLIEIKK